MHSYFKIAFHCTWDRISFLYVMSKIHPSARNVFFRNKCCHREMIIMIIQNWSNFFMYRAYHPLSVTLSLTNVSSPWIWKGVSATLKSGRYTLSYPRGRYVSYQQHNHCHALWFIVFVIYFYNYIKRTASTVFDPIVRDQHRYFALAAYHASINTNTNMAMCVVIINPFSDIRC